MDARLRQFVRERAGDRCEYCGIPQDAIEATLHVEHVIAKQHRGQTVEGNLALACDRCNRQKGTNLSAVDPETGSVVRFYNPRTDEWNEHFALVAAEIIGLSPVGRATARLLQFNAENRLKLRRRLIARGKW